MRIVTRVEAAALLLPAIFQPKSYSNGRFGESAFGCFANCMKRENNLPSFGGHFAIHFRFLMELPIIIIRLLSLKHAFAGLEGACLIACRRAQVRRESTVPLGGPCFLLFPNHL